MQPEFTDTNYVTFVLSEDSRKKLIEALGAHFEVRVCHHITICYERPRSSHDAAVLQHYIKLCPSFIAYGARITENQVVVQVSPKRGELLVYTDRHITYERSRLVQDKDSKEVINNATPYRFVPLNIVIEGSYQMLEKGGKTPTTINHEWVEEQIKNIRNEPVSYNGELFRGDSFNKHGEPTVFQSLANSHHTISSQAKPSAFGKMLHYWRIRNKDILTQADPSDHIVIHHGEHYRGAHFDDNGLPTVFENVKNIFLNYHARSNKDIFNKMLELWKVRSSYVEKEDYSSKEYKFTKEPFQGSDVWMVAGYSLDGSPLAFVYRSKTSPSRTVEIDRTPGSEYRAIHDAWRRWTILNMVSEPTKNRLTNPPEPAPTTDKANPCCEVGLSMEVGMNGQLFPAGDYSEIVWAIDQANFGEKQIFQKLMRDGFIPNLYYSNGYPRQFAYQVKGKVKYVYLPDHPSFPRLLRAYCQFARCEVPAGYQDVSEGGRQEGTPFTHIDAEKPSKPPMMLGPL